MDRNWDFLSGMRNSQGQKDWPRHLLLGKSLLLTTRFAWCWEITSFLAIILVRS